jgi:hypothetical protein
LRGLRVGVGSTARGLSSLRRARNTSVCQNRANRRSASAAGRARLLDHRGDGGALGRRLISFVLVRFMGNCVARISRA